MTALKFYHCTPGLFKGWIMQSTGEITILWIAKFVLIIFIQWITIYSPFGVYSCCIELGRAGGRRVGR